MSIGDGWEIRPWSELTLWDKFCGIVSILGMIGCVVLLVVIL